LTHNQYGFSTSTLPDTGANCYAAINILLAQECARRLNLTIFTLPHPIPVRGFDGQSAKPATQAIVMNLDIMGRRFQSMPFVMLDIGSYDIILGRTWFAQHNILVSCEGKGRLIFPKEHGKYLSRATTILLPRGLNTIASEVDQLDMERRQLAQELAEGQVARVYNLRFQPTDTPPQRFIRSQQVGKMTQRIAYREALESMRRNLAGQGTKPYQKKPFVQTPTPEPPLLVDCAIISAIGIHHLMHHPTTEASTTSLYELDRIIEDRREGGVDINQVEDWSRAAAQHLYGKEHADPDQAIPKQYIDYSDVFSKKDSDELPPHRPVDHKIELTGDGTLGYSPLYSMSTPELLALKKYLVDNLEKGFIEASQAPFSSPVLFAKKANGGLRFCIDYRKLNSLTKKDRYPIPLIDETLERIARAKIFTKVDIRQAFHRIRMDPASEELTTFRTRYGAYKCKVLPFGLTNGPATFQRYMNDTLMEYLDDFCTAYLDDILIYSDDPLEHHEHVRKVLQRLRDAGLQADLKKCEFGVTTTKYLGFIIGTDGVQADPEKVSVVTAWKVPKNLRGTQSFLGFCNFYRRFIRNYSRIARPLVKLTRKNHDFQWTRQCHEAFEELKSVLSSSAVMKHFQPHLPTRVETDASDGVIGGVMSQLHTDGEWYPVAFLSKTMLPAECNYEIHDKEMLAIVRSLAAWGVHLRGLERAVDIYTDHKALEYFLTTKKLTARQVRWAELLSEFNFVIQYRKGKDNIVADILSRRPEDVADQDQVKWDSRERTFLRQSQVSPEVLVDLGITVQAKDLPEDTPMVHEYILEDETPADKIGIMALDEELEFTSGELDERLRTANRLAASLDAVREEALTNPDSPFLLEEGLLLYQGKLVVPMVDHLVTDLIREAHTTIQTAHAGMNKTIQMLSDRYYWPTLRADTSRFIRNCHPCRRNHVPRDKTPGLLHPLPVPDGAWQHCTMDFKDFNTGKQGFDMIWVIVDRLSKGAISVPCSKKTNARDLARMFITHFVRHHGFPESIVSDRGPQFVSEFWTEVCNLSGIKQKLSTAYQAPTDGQTEIMNQYIDQRLRFFVNYDQDDWEDLMPLMDHAQLILPHASTGVSPFELTHARPARTTFDWKTPAHAPGTPRESLAKQEVRQILKRVQEGVELVQGNMRESQDKMARDFNQHHREPDFDVGDYVWVTMKNWTTARPNKKLDAKNAGPFKIIARDGFSYRLDLPDSMKVKHPVFHANKLRKAATDPLPGQKNDPPPPVVVLPDKENEWVVEEILDCRLHYQCLQYLVSWEGYEDPDSNWYPADNFMYAPDKLRTFYQHHPTKPGPPANLPLWMTEYAAGNEDYDHLAGRGKPMTRAQRQLFFGRGE
jgi:hypothetical protein